MIYKLAIFIHDHGDIRGGVIMGKRIKQRRTATSYPISDVGKDDVFLLHCSPFTYIIPYVSNSGHPMPPPHQKLSHSKKSCVTKMLHIYFNHSNDLKGLYATIEDRKSTRLNSSHVAISYAVFCLKK